MTEGDRDASPPSAHPPPEGESDRDLVRAVRAGDRDALERLARRYLRPVHAVVASFLSDPDEVEDAAQETFLRALRSLDRYDPRRPFAPWIHQIARNVARHRLEDRGRWRVEALPQGGGPSGRSGPEEEAARREIRERVALAMHDLPEQRRTAFRLVDVEGMSAAEAGRMMGLTPGTVRSHVHHARRALREVLRPWEPTSAGEGGADRETPEGPRGGIR